MFFLVKKFDVEGLYPGNDVTTCAFCTFQLFNDLDVKLLFQDIFSQPAVLICDGPIWSNQGHIIFVIKILKILLLPLLFCLYIYGDEARLLPNMVLYPGTRYYLWDS